MKYHIISIGCQMNKSDSERMASVFNGLGNEMANTEDGADIVAVNACSVRQAGIHKIFSKIDQWNEKKAKNKQKLLITILTGCVIPEDRKKFEKLFDIVMNIKDLPELGERIDGVIATVEKTPQPPLSGGLSGLPTSSVPPRTISELSVNLVSPEAISELPINSISSDEAVIRTSPPDKGGWGVLSVSSQPKTNPLDYFHIKPTYQNPWSVFVPIMTGCNNFCSYCAVPYTRGREISREVKDLLNEISELAKNNCQEITLLGQNVNTYTPQDTQNFSKNNPYQDSFAALLWEINQIPNLNRVHFTASHPKDMSDEVIDALTLPKMVNFLHLPAQAGDDEVLRRMNRNYTADDYLKLIKKIKDKKPEIALGTDLIVGFPGETPEQFDNTVKFYEEVGFDISYTAKYSPRSGTVAYKMQDDVSLEEKKRRWFVMQHLMEKTALEKNQKYLNQKIEVLVDKKTDNLYEGNSREYKRVRFYADQELLGKVVKVKVEKAMMWMLEGKII